LGIEGPSDTLGSPWPSIAIRPWIVVFLLSEKKIWLPPGIEMGKECVLEVTMLWILELSKNATKMCFENVRNYLS
jgi:hypothetical protein